MDTNAYCGENAEAYNVSSNSSPGAQSQPHNSIYQQTSDQVDPIIHRIDMDNTHTNSSILIAKKHGHIQIKAETVPATANNTPEGFINGKMDADKRKCSNNVPVSNNGSNQVNRKTELAIMLHNFIENLAEQLPGISKASSFIGASDVNVNLQQSSEESKVRPTTELLEELQQALAVPPASLAKNLFSQRELAADCQLPELAQSKATLSRPKYGHVTIRINRGRYYLKLCTTESTIAQTHLNTASTEEVLSTFCTFKAIPLHPADRIDSSIKTYSTKPTNQCHAPEWHEQFDVSLDSDELTIYSWHRNRNLCAPATYLGRTAIDLQTISRGSPSVDDWHKVEDDNGQSVGFIEVILQFQLFDFWLARVH